MLSHSNLFGFMENVVQNCAYMSTSCPQADTTYIKGIRFILPTSWGVFSLGEYKMKLKSILFKLMNASVLLYVISYIVAFSMIALLSWILANFVLIQADISMTTADWATFSMAASIGDSVNLRTDWALRTIPTESWILFSIVLKVVFFSLFSSFWGPETIHRLIYSSWFFLQLTILSSCVTLFIIYSLKDKKNFDRNIFLLDGLRLFPLIVAVNCLIVYIYYFAARITTVLTYDLPVTSLTFLLFTIIFYFIDKPNKSNFAYLVLFSIPLIFFKETLLIPIFILLTVLLTDKQFPNNRYYSVCLLLTLAASIGLRILYATFILKGGLGSTTGTSFVGWNLFSFQRWRRNLYLFADSSYYGLKNSLLFVSPIFFGIILIKNSDLLDHKKRLILIMSSLTFLFVIFVTLFLPKESRVLLEYGCLMINVLLSKKLYKNYLENSDI